MNKMNEKILQQQNELFNKNIEEQAVQPRKLQLNKKQLQFPQAVNVLLFVGAGLLSMYFFQFALLGFMHLGKIMLGGLPSEVSVLAQFIAGILTIAGYIVLISMISVKALRVQYAATRTAAILMLVSLGISILVIILNLVLLTMHPEPFAFTIVVRILQAIDLVLKTVACIFGIVIYIEYTIDNKMSKQILQGSFWLSGACIILTCVSLILGYIDIGNMSLAVYAIIFTCVLWRVHAINKVLPLVFMWIGFAKQVLWSIGIVLVTLLTSAGKLLEVYNYQMRVTLEQYWILYVEQNVVMLFAFLALIICTAVATRIKYNHLQTLK